MTGYGRPLAAAHHQDFGWAATGAAQLLLDALAKRHPSGLAVDLGCGSGILARIVSRRGYDVLGVDQSASMLEIARREAPEARFLRASAFDFEPPPCVGVTAIGEVLQYMFDERASLATLRKVARRVYNALAPGGVFLFDISAPGRAGPSGETQRVWDRDEFSMLFSATEDKRRKILIRKQVLFVPEGKKYRRVDETHLLRLIEPERVEDMLRKVGFTVRRLSGYPGGPDIVAWNPFLARKPVKR